MKPSAFAEIYLHNPLWMVWSGNMDTRRRKAPMTDQLRGAMDDIGAEPLEGSGFGQEMPEEQFSDTEPAAPEALGVRAGSAGFTLPFSSECR